MNNASTNRILYALCAVAFVLVVIRVISNVRGPDALVPQLPQSEVQAFAREQLAAIQVPSFEDNIELCGIIWETSEQELGASAPKQGHEASCDLAYFDEPGMVPIASFHTHGSYSRQYDSEVPSLQDIQSDVANGTDGYVATPGGRFWHIDHEQQIARLICGPGCLPQDPAYVPCASDTIARSYTPEELRTRFTTPSRPC